jgi:predicted acylesterase/phospholipase RssA
MQCTPRFRALVIASASGLLFGACSVVRTDCPACPKQGVTYPTQICSSDPAVVQAEMAATIFVPGMTSNTDAPEMLFMSAGGSWGAYGAGVLYGWGQQGTRPQFEIVTGSSTGALLGVFAILGGPCPGPSCLSEIDEKMKEVYTTVTNDDIFKTRSLLTIGYSNSISTLEPLRELIEATFTPTIVAQVGSIYASSGRQLWVGTTNLDTGEFCNWNLSKIASLGQYQRFVDLLVASSANPGVFDPIFIDNALHADGGVRHQIYGPWVEGAVNAYTAARTGVATPTPDKPTAYAIVNGQMAARKQCVMNQILPVMLRASQILMNDALVGDLYHAKARLSAGVPAWDLYTTRVPGDYPLWPSPDQFKPADMLSLFNVGLGVGGNMGKWTAGIPTAGVPETACLPLL